jgi:HlyD family secretion protein
MKGRIALIVVILIVLAAIGYYLAEHHKRSIVLTGIVTTDEVIVSSEIQGRLQELLVREGDDVTNGQLLAVIQPAEQKADLLAFTESARQSAAQATQAQADLRYQQAQTSNLTWQSEANLAVAKEQVAEARADLENLSLEFNRQKDLYKQGVASVKEYDAARTSYDSGAARVQSLEKQVVASEAALAMAQSTTNQIAARRAFYEAGLRQRDVADAQEEKAAVVLGHTEIRAPVDSIVDVRAALQGEVVTPGQGIVTLINPTNLWVRADVEETYIDKVKLGDKFTVRLPSGDTREGVVFYRGADADYATQRDVSRTKRDIKTFEIRLRCNNDDRKLAVGMTAFVLLNLD